MPMARPCTSQASARGHGRDPGDPPARQEPGAVPRQGEPAYRELVESANSIMLRRTRDGTITFFNAFAQRFFGFTEEEVLGRSVLDTIVPERDAFGRDLPAMIREISAHPEQYANNENENVCKDGRRVWIQWTNRALRDARGEVVELLCIGNDVTARKRTEEGDRLITSLLALFAKQATRQAYLEAVVEVVRQWIGCRCVGIRARNAQGELPFEAWVGYTDAFLAQECALTPGRDPCVCTRAMTQTPDSPDGACLTAAGSFRCDNMAAFFAGLTASERARYRTGCVEQGFASVAVIPIRRQDQVVGAIHFADTREAHIAPDRIQFAESILTYIIGEALYRFDIEQSLRQSESKYKTLVERLPAITYIAALDAAGTCRYISPQVETLLGFPPETYTADQNPWRRHLHPDDQERVLTALADAHRRRQPFALEYRLVTRDRRDVWFRDEGAVVSDERGAPLFLQGVLYDITRQKKAEAAWRQLAAIVEHSHDAIIGLTLEGLISSWNKGAEGLFGHAAEDVKGWPISILAPPGRPDTASDWLDTLRRGEAIHHHETLWLRHDGQPVHVALTMSAIRDEKGRVMGASVIARDITERKRAQQAVEAYQEELRSLSSRLSLAEEQARRQLAAALHDSVGQMLSLTRIKLGALGERLADEADRTLYLAIRNLVDAAMAQTRTLCFELSPPILYELGLEAAIEWLGEDLQRHYGFRFHFEHDDPPPPTDESTRILIFQSVRELLVNAGKHAAARHVRVASRLGDGLMTVEVRDDGRGFDGRGERAAAGKSGSFGLFSIRERMRHIGGTFRIASAHGQGTTATLSVPLHAPGGADGERSATHGD